MPSIGSFLSIVPGLLVEKQKRQRHFVQTDAAITIVVKTVGLKFSFDTSPYIFPRAVFEILLYHLPIPNETICFSCGI